MFRRFYTMQPKWFGFIILFFFFFGGIVSTDAGNSLSQCRDRDLQDKIEQAAKEVGVDKDELLSILAHESRCHYYTIAWNLPGAPSTAQSKYLSSLQEAKTLAEELIQTGRYRVDVGIGQINNEAHLQPKGWSLDEVLDPNTAIKRVAQVLKERSWLWYHSSNPFYARKWRELALNALHQVSSDSLLTEETASKDPQKFNLENSFINQKSRAVVLPREVNKSNLLVFTGPTPGALIPVSESLDLSKANSAHHKRGEAPLVIYGSL